MVIEKKHDANSISAIISIILAVVLWSTSFAAIKSGMKDFPPISFAAVRFILAAVIISSINLIFGKKEKIEKEDFYKLALGGLLGITLLFLFHNLAMKKTTSADANIVVACYPIIMIVIENIIKKAKISLAQIAGIIISIIGIIIILGKFDNSGQSNRMFGNLLVFFAGISWAFYNMVTKKIGEKYSALTVTYWQTIFGMFGLVLLSFTEAKNWKLPSSVTISAALYLAIACSIGAYLLYGIGLRKLRPGIAVNLMNLQPGFGVIIALLLLGESITQVQIAGGMLIVLGVIISIRFAKVETECEKINA